jgi:hypothetical protein
MSRKPRTTTPRSKLRAIGRTIDDLPRDDEARSQDLQSVMPWVWLQVGILVVATFAALLLAVGPSARRPTPKQSVAYAMAARHHSR